MIDPEQAAAQEQEARARPGRWGHNAASGKPWAGRRPGGWGGYQPKQGPGARRHRPRFIFLRLAFLFGLIALLVTGGMGVMAFLLTRLAGGPGRTAIVVWISGCGLSLALPLLALRLAVEGFRRVATPLADVMAAAEAVAAGDFDVQVPEDRPGEFGRLARSFNHMTEQLALAERQRRNLTSDVAHELRTPLHIIQGNLEGVLDGVYESTPEHIAATLEETRLLGRLVEDLRTLALAEANQLGLVREPVDLAELMLDAATSFSGQAEAAGIDLWLEAPGHAGPLTNAEAWFSSSSPYLVEADPDRLNQVLGNLLVNAIRHSPAGGRITLRVGPAGAGRAGANDPDRLQLQVEDNGEGIPAADLPHIFDRFWRGDRARERSGGSGGGLGLAIAQQLVRAHGGDLAVASQVSQGTTFTITLPVSSQGPAAARPSSRPV